MAGVTVKRRRECLDCGFRFTTHEIDKKQYEKLLMIIKEESEEKG